VDDGGGEVIEAGLDGEFGDVAVAPRGLRGVRYEVYGREGKGTISHEPGRIAG
jgi:hypothetical protein